MDSHAKLALLPETSKDKILSSSRVSVPGERSNSTDKEIIDTDVEETGFEQSPEPDTDMLSPTASVDIPIRHEWIGTSQLATAQSVNAQLEGFLNPMISWRGEIIEELNTKHPYAIHQWLDLADLYSKLGYTDIATACAYRALLLVEAAMKFNDNLPNHPNLTLHVQNYMTKKLQTSSNYIMADELNTLLRECYRSLGHCLLGTGAYWEGLDLVKKGLMEFPKDTELLSLNATLKSRFIDKHQALKEMGVTDPKELVLLSRTAKIYQKKYPWMDEALFKRTPALVRKINEGLAVEGCCEVRPVVFGTPEEIAEKEKRVIKEGDDVGPLGLFATRDLKPNELIFADQFCTAISDIPYNEMTYCDFCHAYLDPPYNYRYNVIQPQCCNCVRYCGLECYYKARGYHKILCGQDFQWLFREDRVKLLSFATTWRSFLWLRVVAVVLSTLEPGQHPLQHPLLARAGANYTPLNPETLKPETSHEWQYWDNVIAPARILSQLGIDIFQTKIWTQDVIQTIFWRIDNNANMANIRLDNPQNPKSKGKIYTMVTMSPNYLFFNHSCTPNVSWNGTVDGNESVDLLKYRNGEIGKPGASAVWCRAGGSIRKGEELKISYVGNPMGVGEKGGRKEKREMLDKWFEGGCGCGVCEGENEVERQMDLEEAGAEGQKGWRVLW